MIQKELTVMNESGFHAQSAAKLVNFVRNYKGVIHVTCDGKRGNLKSIISVLSLGIRRGDRLTLQVEGEQEEQFAEILAEYITQLSG